MLACVRRRSMRSSGVPPAPNRRSKITCGLRSIGSGDVGDDHEIVFAYAQLYPAPQTPSAPTSSMHISSDGSGFSWPMLCASTWSIVMPA